MGGTGEEMRKRGRTGRDRVGHAIAAGAAALLLAAVPGVRPPAAAAQEADVLPPPSVTAVAGLFVRDGFQGDGTSGMGGLRVRFPLGRHVVVEPGVVYTSFRPDTVGRPGASDDDVELLFLDFQIQAQLPLGRFRPWVGIGAGGAADFRADRGIDPFLISSLSGSLGVAVDLAPRLTVLGGALLRTLDDLDRRALEVVLGVGWRP